MVTRGLDGQAHATRYPCSCCGFKTLTDPATGSYEICPVCFWEDDPVQKEDPQFVGGANAVSLIDARENYSICGACEPRFSGQVRSVHIDEVPSPPMLRGLDSANRAEFMERIKRLLLGIVRAILVGEIGILDGCSAIAGVGFELYDAEFTEIMRTFEIIAGESDEFPTGETRDLWAPEALKIKDTEAAEYERRVRNDVEGACVRLKNHLEAEIT